MGALAEMEKVAATVGAVVGELEPERLAGGDAATLVEVFATVKKLCGAGEALAARRVAETMEWRRAGERSAAHWLARRTGSTVGAAAASIETAQRLEDLPATDEAFRTGRLSQVQAQHIASAAAGRPHAETELLDVAERDSLQGLRDACQRTAAAGQADRPNAKPPSTGAATSKPGPTPTAPAASTPA